ncbi:hypothetical protein LNP00_05040 [Fructobacillus sp. M158]|uniref:hypothetical protein n=1 Tax=Fructobacillus parabroussonetiae TaxID=2713174 RepID=UPI00200A70FB|nr:hypothetical protein [Fructobacillus parabroussonetiae]MCK8617731.1 hypothetical protein [Fructobacillus parabroussonetiae]
MTTKAREKQLSHYNKLLNLNYTDAVQALLADHGVVSGNYFIEESYNKWIAGNIKSPQKNKTISRTGEGLELHHNAEDEYEDMGNPLAIQKQDIPFSLQTAEALCYVDKWEHTILHALIARETKGQHGLRGLNTYLIPTIKAWYIDEETPSSSAPQWIQNCYKTAYLDKDAAKALLTKIINMLDDALKDVTF